MGTIANNFYRVKYQILQSSTDPTAQVGNVVVTDAMVNAASANAAVTALLADLSLSGSQRLNVIAITQVENGVICYN